MSTILSVRARDEATEKAALAVFAEFPDSESLARSSLTKLRELIQPVGMTASKANVLRAMAEAVMHQHQGDVPRDFESLLSLPGVGRKTANAVIVFGFSGQAIPVDSHIYRVTCRIAGQAFTSPAKVENYLSSTVPSNDWNRINPILVQHGQNLCRSSKPRCSECPISDDCSYGREHGSRGQKLGLRLGRRNNS